ncbi:mucin-5AC-like [Betta splendens]|uniref:Mucin-5AC-like n=1 Tax=Betta splendens TaxID=158456 RepID=A0A9W2XVC4_BETSP|nr:mucin-5AC-like [Betta splendens]
MSLTRMQLEWVIPWFTLCLGLSGASFVMTTPSSTIMPVLTEMKSSHNQFCSTWGNYHYKTYDGDFFQLPFTCNYLLTSHCKSDYETFNIQLQREEINGVTSIKKVSMKLDGVVVELTNTSIIVNDKRVTIPYIRAGISIKRSGSYVKMEAKLGMDIMWNQEDTLWVELDSKFKNQTCGLCGDYNGAQIFNEFQTPDMESSISIEDYGELSKINGPTESCQEISPVEQICSNETEICKNLLSEPAFLSCQNLIDTDSFIKACAMDLCSCSNSSSSCLCSTISEFSRQCAHAGGRPQKWTTNKLCEKSCPLNLEYSECGNPCTDTCSNQHRKELCTEHCIDGCFCPSGTLLDDVTHSGCVAVEQCPCLHNGQSYQPGDSYSSTCHKCTCSQGQWSCLDVDCPGVCSIVGGSHINTYDAKTYTFHGDCSYVLTKGPNGTFTVHGDLERCEKSEKSTCLSAVTLSLPNEMIFVVKESGQVLFNSLISQLPLYRNDFTAFSPSTFFIVIHTIYGVDLEIQIIPYMQVYIKASVSNKGQLTGLCGDFNDVEVDDFKNTNGLIEGTAESFANTWKSRTNCPDVTNTLGDPCTINIQKEKYANHWCSLLTDSNEIFAQCHSEISPKVYHTNCIYDSCACDNSEECMCAALSSYVHACAAAGVFLNGWRDTACGKYIDDCPATFVYDYQMTSCGRTCRSLTQSELTCDIDFTPLDGCGCAEGTYLDDKGECVTASQCPCQMGETVVQAGNVIKVNGQTCSCHGGNLICSGSYLNESCSEPMVYFNCSGAKPGDKGSECQKSCSLATECLSKHCISGCVCPDGLLSDGNGGCVEEEDCPCTYNGESYNAGQSVTVGCNTCTCKGRNWACTDNECDGVCTIYGEGHYTTFDQRTFTFNGNCVYVVTQDFCDDDEDGSFRVLIENVPCGTTESICSTSIKLYLGNSEIVLSEENVKVINQSRGVNIPFHVNTMGIYVVIEAQNGLVVIWNRLTTLIIRLRPAFQGKVCGLCGNYDGNVKNDFTTRSKEVVVDPLEFGNTWKLSSTCPNAVALQDPCSVSPHRQAWAAKHCSIINSDVFAACHSKVPPQKYYDACVGDTCGCNTGGDCECFCTAVAVYAAVCNEAGACVRWRTPTVCPLFCDYYNPDGECEWHYEPCGKPCMKTCRNPSGTCYNKIPALEGCYPRCPPEKKYLEEVTMKCVSREQCGCYDEDGNHYNIGEQMPSNRSCETCHCSSGTKNCLEDKDYPEYGKDGGDRERVDSITVPDIGSCKNILNIECRATQYKDLPIHEVGQNVTCSPTYGLICNNKDQQNPSICYNYEIRVKCCIDTCPPGTSTTTEIATTTTTTEIPTTTTTTESTTTTTTTESPTTTTATEIPTTTTTTEIPTTTTTTESTTTPTTTESPPTTTTTEIATTTTTTEIPTTTTTTESTTTTTTTESPTTTTATEIPTTTTTTEIPTTTTTTESPPTTTTTESTVYVNGKQVFPTYSNQDFTITSTSAIEMLLKIPAIEAIVSFKGIIFTVELPYSLFKNNTEGQCGTCDNNTSNDCRLPSGQIHPSCSEMANSWNVNDTNKPYCEKPPAPAPRPTIPTKPTTTSTTPPPICEVLHSKVFENCTKVIPVENFYKACIYDVTHMPNSTVGCSSVQVYAKLCADASICVDWRSATKGLCDYKCPANKVYKPCGPTFEPTCNARYNDKYGQECQGANHSMACSFTEGCFCPKGLTLFGSNSDICVSACCAGPDGSPKKYGDTWQSGCQQCDCNENAMGVRCQPLTCPIQDPVVCKGDGQVLVTRTVGCCNQSQCECDTHLCPSPIQNCQLGFKLENQTSSDSCCPSYGCVPKNVCVFNETEYRPGVEFFPNPCDTCQCSKTQDPETKLNVHTCHSKECLTLCPKGFVYQKQPGQCCGSCKQISCVAEIPGFDTVIINSSQSWSPPNDKCSTYSCKEVNGVFTVQKDKMICPPFDQDNCVPGTEQSDTNGCCKTCTPRYSCKMNTNTTYLVVGSCRSIEPVDIKSCEGSCESSSSTMYSAESNSLTHSCKCCREMLTSNKTVKLLCTGGIKRDHTYISVDKCGCQVAKCSSEEET